MAPGALTANITGRVLSCTTWITNLNARELLAYLDTDLAVEGSLPFAVSFLVEKMRAAVFAKAARTLAPAHRCRIYRNCRLS